MHSHVHSSIIYNRQDMETIYMFFNGETDKEVFIYIHIHMYIRMHIQWNIIQSLKTQENTICDNMDGP